ncbi:MAG: GNAT family N-acetyltransferase [Treponema sp.]|nr:GNAT family N-acetyltransferase [Treponema sp.]
MVEIRKATDADIEDLMAVRCEMLRVVNGLAPDYAFDDTLCTCSRDYFLTGDQTTVLARDCEAVIGCASISYIRVMPTFEHPTGTRAHLMNVYTNEAHRRQGIARKMIQLLIDEAKERGCTEISLDATEAGRPLYESLGFSENCSGMTLALKAPPCTSCCHALAEAARKAAVKQAQE